MRRRGARFCVSNSRQLCIGSVVVMDDLKLGMPPIVSRFAVRRSLMRSRLFPRLEDDSQRPGQEGGEINQLGHRSQPQDDKHQYAKSLGWRERADRKDGEP